MAENRRLDEFADPESREDAEGSADSAGSSEGEESGLEALAEAEAEEEADPAQVTHDWTPGGAPCADCGESVEERWRAGEGAADADAMVCADCKAW